MAFNVKPNILHDFASYTYKFTLYMVPITEFNETLKTEDISLVEIHTKKFSKKVVLLESGSTATNINNVTINIKPTMDFVDITSIRMQCLQTKGFSFIETIVKACELCGIVGNPTSSGRYFLELTFVGITDNGVEKFNIFTITYPVMITDIVTNMTINGASYDISLSIENLISKEDSISTVPTIITMTDVKDTDSFFTRFESAINEAYSRDTTEGQSVVNTCKIVADPELLGHPIKNNDGSSPVFDYSLNFDDATGASFNIPARTSIPKIIEGVLSNVPAIAENILNDDIVAKVVHVEPVVTNGEFVPSLNAYTSDVTWYVRLKSHYKYVSPTNVDSNKQLKLLAENGDLSKAYNYYFTGENTEVISLDMNFSTLYATVTTQYNSIFDNYAKQMGFASTTVPSQEEELERETSESQKSSNQFSSKPAFTDNSGSEVFYVDDYEKVDMDLVKSIGAKIVKKPVDTNDNASYTSQTSDSTRAQYMTELNNIRNLTYNSTLLTSLTMEIRGDPHWLMPRNVYLKPSDSTSNPRRMNLIYLKLGFPIDETKEDVHIDETLSKLYEVKEIVAEFNNGKFIQKLKSDAINSIPRSAIEGEIRTNE